MNTVPFLPFAGVNKSKQSHSIPKSKRKKPDGRPPTKRSPATLAEAAATGPREARTGRVPLAPRRRRTRPRFGGGRQGGPWENRANREKK